MADLLVNLKLDGKEFNTAISQSTNQIRQFKQDSEKAGTSVNSFGSKLQSMAIGGIAKFAGAVGAAYSATEIFNGIINSTQGTSDAFEVTIGATRDTVDQFFKAISSGDFTNFINGLDNIFSRAKTAREELDQLWNTINAVGLAQTKATTKQMQGRDIANDPDLSPEERMKGLEMWEEGVKDYADATQTQIEDTESTIKSIVSTYNTLDPEQITIPIITETILVDAKGKPIREALKEKYDQQYKDYQKEVIKAKKDSEIKNNNSYSVFNVYAQKGSDIDQDKFQSKLKVINQKYKEAIIANAVLEKMSDKQLEDTTNKLKSIEQQQGVIYQQSYQYSKGSQRVINQMNKKDKSSGSNKKNSEEILPEGSIAYLEKRIADLNKQIKLETDPVAYKAIQKEIESLEKKIVYIKVIYTTDFDPNEKISNSVKPLNAQSKYIKDGKIDVSGISITAPDLTESMSWFDTYINALDVVREKNKGMIESFDSISNSLLAIGDASNNSVGAMFRWLASVTSSVGQAIPIIEALIMARKAEANANAEAAATGAAASVAGIPVVGALLAVGAVATVLASLASIPKFANGGLVYGNTIAQVGEYPGASSNPEVIAPLSKLRDILSDTNNGIGSGTVDFKISGKDLVGVISNYSHKNSKK